MGEVIVHEVDISEIVHHHSLKLLFIINKLVISYTHSKGKGVMAWQSLLNKASPLPCYDLISEIVLIWIAMWVNVMVQTDMITNRCFNAIYISTLWNLIHIKNMI